MISTDAAAVHTYTSDAQVMAYVPPHQMSWEQTQAFGVLNAHRVIATCQPANVASYRVMETIGMRREAHFRQCTHRGGDIWWDAYFYALLQKEWQGQL